MESNNLNQNEYEFLTFEEVQATITNFYSNHGYKISFKEAVDILKTKRVIHNSAPKMPDFTEWNTNDNSSLRKLINQFPIDIKPLYNKVFKDRKFSDLENIHEKGDIFFLQIFNDCPVEMKSHNFYEIYYSLSGSCDIYIKEEKFTINENEFFFIAPYLSHCPENSDDNILLSFLIRPSKFEKLFFNLLIQNNLLSEFFKETLHGINSRINHLHFSINNQNEIKPLLKLLLIEFHKANSYSNEICINLMSVVFSVILRDYENQKNFISENKNSNLIIKYIEQNYSTVSLSKLSEVFGYEKTYLGKIIKKNSGFNFSELINNIRLKHACLLLKNKNFNISDISEIVGFNSPDYFSKAFKKTYGCSPRNYTETV